jgi:superoxide dismutase
MKKVKRAMNGILSGFALWKTLGVSANAAENVDSPKITFKPLPYDYKALEPFISEKSLFYHHDKHHAKYVSTTLSMIKGTDLEDADLVSVMRNCDGIAPVIFNNAAQSWNHEFYWNCMKKGGGGKPSGIVADAIDKTFGSYDEFKKQVRFGCNSFVITYLMIYSISKLL